MRKTMFRWLIALAILLPCMVVTASAATQEITLDVTGLESDHDYANDTSKSWNMRVNFAETVFITFDERTEFENNCDFLKIYGYAGNLIEQYTGTELAGTTIEISGSDCSGYISLKLESDSSVAKWGFKIVSATATVPEIVNSGTCGGEGDGSNLTWTMYGDGELVISGKGAMANWNAESYDYSDYAPWHGYRDSYRAFEKVTICDGVTSIGDYAFESCPYLTSVTIPDSVKTIGTFAFEYCAALSSVDIPDSVSAIGSHAFESCFSLTDVVIPNSMKIIEDSVFSGCGLTSVTIPDSVTSIGASAFSGCSLTNIVIPDSVTEIGAWAFALCDMTAIEIPDSVKSIGEYAFCQCDNLTSITIGSGVTSLGDSVFWRDDRLKMVEFRGNAPTSVGEGLFDDVYGATIKVPVYYHEGTSGWPTNGTWQEQELLMIPAEPISGTYNNYGSNLTWTLSTDGELTITGSGAMTNHSANSPWEDYCIRVKTVTIGDGITSVGRYAFDDFSSLTSVDIPDSVTSIGYGAFDSCISLTSVTIPDNVTSIGQYAFYNCNHLTGVTIPDSVTSIGSNAFALCTRLTSVTIPSSVTTINDRAFYSCSKLTSVIFLGDAPSTVGSDVFYYYDYYKGDNRGLTIYCHEDTSGWPTTGTWQGYPLVQQPHTEEITPAVAPTCGTDGATAGSYCSVCEKVLSGQTVIPATGSHGYQLDTAVAATCTESGLTAGASCPTCSYVHLAQEVVPATGHTTVVDAAVEATCKQSGLTEGSHCSNCGEVFVAQQTVAQKTHSVVVDQPVAATCTEVGYSSSGMHCSVCGDVLLAQTEIPALGHDYIDHAAKAPTTDSVGWETYQTCSRCNYSTYVELPKLEAVKPTRFKFSLAVVNTIVLDGQTVEICRWSWTPIYE